MLIPTRDLNQYQALLTTARTQAIKRYMWNRGTGRTSQMIPQIFLPISDISSLTQNIHLFHSCTLNNNKNLLYLECIHIVFHQVFAHSTPSLFGQILGIIQGPPHMYFLPVGSDLFPLISYLPQSEY